MRSALQRLRFVLLLVPALALAACGGDGTKMVAIDQNNAEDVAASALGAAEFVGELAGLVDELVDIIEDGVVGELDCPLGGTMEVTIDDVAPLGEISDGDSVSIRFIGCTLEFDGEQLAFNGVLEFSITSASFPGAGAYDILVRAAYRNLMLSGMGVTFTVNGGLNLQLETPDGIVYTTVASGSSLKVSVQVGAIVATNAVSGFRYEQVYDEATGDYTLTGYGRVYDAELGASFDSEVLVPLEGTDPAEPDTGQFECVGSGLSAVLLIALPDAVNVELRVDADGDGNYETTIPSTWAALRGDDS